MIATKAGLTRQGPDSWIAVGRPAYLRQQAELSLRRLGSTGSTCSSCTASTPTYPLEDQVGELKALQDEGKIRHIGLSEVSVEELQAAQQVADDRVGAEQVQPRRPRLPGAPRPLHGSRASASSRGARWPTTSTTAALQEVAAAHDATASQVALAWLLRLSPVMVPIPGTSTVAHLEENTAAAALELTDDEVRLAPLTQG